MVKKTVCLNMIVRNESSVIQRCLDSVKGFIDYWVIVDTGSIDGTQKIIRERLKDIPGELLEMPWVDFEHNRNQSLAIAKEKADYLLFIDADELLEYPSSFSWPSLEWDCVIVPCRHENSTSQSILLANSRLEWKWKGARYETLVCPQELQGAFIESLTLRHCMDGHRWKNRTKKFLDDAKVLEKAIEKNPADSRSIFALAECYEGAKKYELALKNYEKRSEMKGNDPEVFVSLYRMGLMQEQLKMEPEVFIKSLLKAYQYRPTRPEPLFCIANYFMSINSHLLGYLIARHAVNNPLKNDYFHTQSRIYEYGLLDQLSECAFRIGKYRESYDALVKMLNVKTLPEDVRKAGEKNLALPVFAEFQSDQEKC